MLRLVDGLADDHDIRVYCHVIYIYIYMHIHIYQYIYIIYIYILSPPLLRLVDGLADDHDIRVYCHVMLCKLAAAPSATAVLTASLDALVDPLRKTICASLKDNAVPQQVGTLV